MNVKEKIVRRAALELQDGEYVNLGFGIPTSVSNDTPKGVNVFLQAENGCLQITRNELSSFFVEFYSIMGRKRMVGKMENDWSRQDMPCGNPDIEKKEMKANEKRTA